MARDAMVFASTLALVTSQPYLCTTEVEVGLSIPVVLLAGGLGTRMREETEVKPKPMVDVGGYPILWHIMKIYHSYGFREFVVCLGYRGDVIKDFFRDYHMRHGSMTINTASGEVTMHDQERGEDWVVHLLETGAETMTGGRIKRAAEFLGPRRFMATYGDGVADIDLAELVRHHESCGRKATITAVRPPARFGGLQIEGSAISQFIEKPQIGEGWINGGFMVFEPGIAGRIAGDDTVLERAPLEGLAHDGELSAYRHNGFWQCTDTVRDLTLLRQLWDSDQAPWKLWC